MKVTPLRVGQGPGSRPSRAQDDQLVTYDARDEGYHGHHVTLTERDPLERCGLKHGLAGLTTGGVCAICGKDHPTSCCARITELR